MYCYMLRSVFTVMLLMCIFIQTSAKLLSPKRALENSLQKLVALSQADINVADLELIQCRQHQGVNTLYVFSSPSMFLIASGDDKAPALLAYSLEGGFSSSEIPPAVEWWLEQYSDAIGCADRPFAASFISRTGRKPVEPMLASKWDQSAPYNNFCPVHDDRKSLTGCVATAMAQIMNYYQWPDKGTGSIWYNYIFGGVSYGHNYNFGDVEFDWENMLDSYDAEATSVQEDAVAELMHACGAAARMIYRPYASSSRLQYAACGLFEYLQYDRGMEFLDSEWFDTAEEWDKLCYEELVAGRPILYGGVNDEYHNAHAFVMDGYSKEGLYHINWGWGGRYDGFFLLPDFSYPEGNYRKEHKMVRGIKPAEESSVFIPSISMSYEFYTDRSVYEKHSSQSVKFMQDFTSESLCDYWIYHGVKCVPVDGSAEFYVSCNTPQWYRPGGINYYFEIPADDFPNGIYNLYPVFRTETGDWLPVYQVQSRKGEGVRFEVTDASINSVTSGIGQVSLDKDSTTEYYDLYGRKTVTPRNGIFVKVEGGKALKVRF